MAELGFYRVNWAYRSALWPEPLEAERIVQITDEQAAVLNRDSPGVVTPVELVEKPPEPEPKPKPKPVVDEEVEADRLARAQDGPPKAAAPRKARRKR